MQAYVVTIRRTIDSVVARAANWPTGETIAEPVPPEYRERRAVPTLAQVGFLVRHYSEHRPVATPATPCAYAFALRISSIDRRGFATNLLRPLALALPGAPVDAPAGLHGLGATWVSPDVVRGLFPAPKGMGR